MKIHPNSLQARELLHYGTLALSRAEIQGIRVDLEYTQNKRFHLTRKIERLEGLFKETKFYRHWSHSLGGKAPNIYSNPQLSSFLYKVMRLTPANKTVSGQGSTNEESLTQLNIPELADLLEIRKLKKIRDTYLENFIKEQVNGYIHPSFNLHLVTTFRSSSDRPNFQNIPKRDKEAMQIVRRALYPRPGHQLMEIDYSGIEVRVAACYHNDPTMIKYIEDPTSDMHKDMAKEIFKIDNFDKSIPGHKYLRQATKNGFVFPQFYGDYYKNCADNMACDWGKLPEGRWKQGQGVEIGSFEPLFLSDHLISKGLDSLDKFTEHVKEIEYHFWNKRFPVYKKWKESWWKQYQRNGYIDMFTGFRCSGLMAKNDAINYPVQGSAFHCLLWSLIEVDAVQWHRQWDTKIIGQIHDAIIFDLNPAEKDEVVEVVKKITCKDLPKAWSWINVPLDVEVELSGVDQSWAEIKPL